LISLNLNNSCKKNVAAMKRTILLALLLACGTVQAAEWVLVGETDQGHRGYIDAREDARNLNEEYRTYCLNQRRDWVNEPSYMAYSLAAWANGGCAVSSQNLRDNS
jgi:hypothetical protein